MRVPPLRIALGLSLVLAATAACAEEPYVVTGGGTVASTAGTVDVECLGRDKIRIVGSSPAPGYTTRVIVDGPGRQVSLIFENPNANDFRVAVHCSATEPRVREWEIEDTTISG